MAMRWYLRSRVLILGLAAVMALTTVAQAQDSEAGASDESSEDPGRGNFYVELSTWVAQPTGLQFSTTTILDPTNAVGTRYVNLDSSTKMEPYFRVGYELPGNGGSFILTYYGHEDTEDLSLLTAGTFLYGAINTSGYLAGVFNDGLADGVVANTRARLRDFRLDYYRPAFKNKRVSGKWFVGYRRIEHLREVETSYYALAPNLPPIMPPVSNPVPALVPRADSASMRSDWEGRGLEAGLEVKIPVRSEKVWFETGLAISVLRGKVSTSYGSTTYFYAITDANRILEILQPPYDEFNDPDFLAVTEQLAADTGIQNSFEGRNASALETWLELRWRYWKYGEFLVGFRNIEYTNVGKDLRTDQLYADRDGNIDGTKLDGTRFIRLFPQTLQSTDHSANYEGFYFGFAFRF
jgi:hypothetical protein